MANAYGKCSFLIPDSLHHTPRRFNLYHSEPLPSARDRYINEVNRVVAVLDGWLEGKTWLVGDKCTYADLAYVMWDMALPIMMQTDQYPERFTIDKYPNFKAWHERMMAMESIRKCMAIRQEIMDAEGRRTDGKKADGSI